MEGIRPQQRAIVDCDKYIAHRNPGHNMCDYIIGCELEGDSVSVIEMKSSGVRASQVIEQLQQGARLAEGWIGNTSVDNFAPILLSKSRNSNELKVFARQKITFQGFAQSIKTKRCGASLQKDIL